MAKVMPSAMMNSGTMSAAMLMRFAGFRKLASAMTTTRRLVQISPSVMRASVDQELPVGFCGFWVFESLGPEPQLLYAFTEPNTGRGYATEAGRALVAAARAQGMTRIVSAVDAPNTTETVGMRICESSVIS